MRPDLWACAAAAARLVTPGLERMLETWVLTVFGLMNSLVAIWVFVEPYHR
jgi:hypothetical protein